MSVDTLRVEPNQRIDYSDFSYMIDESMTAIMRDVADNFLLNPDGPLADRMRILDGFEMTNPVGKQLSVTLGRALLAERIEGVVRYGALVSTGAASQIIDLAPLASATYGVYIRFEYIDSDSASRVFWNPAGAGSEFVQNVPTRRSASWSLRAELTPPGPEWLLIGTANNAGAGLVLVDQRVLYFEGPVAGGAYTSGWSTEGGGAATDRDPDRLTYGVKDLHTFTAAMKQSIEDIRGRGLRRWWDKGIGGINVGFDDDPFEDTLAVGDENAYLWNGGTQLQPTLGFDVDDWFWYDRPTNTFHWGIATLDEAILNTSGLSLAKGLYVGSTAGVPTADDVTVDGDFLAPTGGVNAGGAVDPTAGNGIFTSGLVVGYDAQPATDQVRVGDEFFRMEWDGVDPLLSFDDGDDIIYDRSADSLTIRRGGSTRFVFDGIVGNLSMIGGVRAGSSAAAYDNDFWTSNGGISCGTSRDPDFGEGIFTGGVSAGWDGNPLPGFLYLNSAAFLLGPVGGAPTLQFASNNWIRYNSGPDAIRMHVGNIDEVKITNEGISCDKGIYIGSAVTTAADNELSANTVRSRGNIYYFGSGTGDRIDFDGVGDIYRFYRNSVLEYEFGPTIADFHGNNLANVATIGATAITCTSLDAGAGTIQTTGDLFVDDITADIIDCNSLDMNGGSISNALFVTASGRFRFDANNYWWKSSGTDYAWVVNSTETMRLFDTGLQVRNGGLNVGQAAITAPVTTGKILATVEVEAPLLDATTQLTTPLVSASTVNATVAMTSPYFDASSYLEAPTWRYNASNYFVFNGSNLLDLHLFNGAHVASFGYGANVEGLRLKGGLHLGDGTTAFTVDVTDHQLSVGIFDFGFEYTALTHYLNWDTNNDRFAFSPASNEWTFQLGGLVFHRFNGGEHAQYKCRVVSTDDSPNSSVDPYSRTIWNSIVCAGWFTTSGLGVVTGFGGWNVSGASQDAPDSNTYTVTTDYPLDSDCVVIVQQSVSGGLPSQVGEPLFKADVFGGDLRIDCHDSSSGVPREFLSGRVMFICVGRTTNTSPSI